MERVLAKARVVLHELQALFRVDLVFCRRIVVLSVLGAHEADDLTRFSFLRHLTPLGRLNRSSLIPIRKRRLAAALQSPAIMSPVAQVFQPVSGV